MNEQKQPHEGKPLTVEWPTCPHCGVKVHLLEHRCRNVGYPLPGIFTPEQHEVLVKWFNEFYTKTAPATDTGEK